MSTKARDIDGVYKKLRMEVEDTHHRIAWFVEGGVRVLSTYRSHGNKDVPPPVLAKMRGQLRVSESEMRGLITCHLDRPEYVRILEAKGVLPTEG